MLINILLAVCVIYFVSWLGQWIRNYSLARKSGLPILLCPVYPNGILWMIISVQCWPYLEKYLPRFIWMRLKFAIYGWEFFAKLSIQKDLGVDTFLLVTPRTIELWTANPQASQQVLARLDDFRIFEMSKVIIGAYGPNVLTAEGDDWKRQRKVIASLINEKISKTVWDESCDQADEMLDYYLKSRDTKGMVEAMREVAIGVLGKAGYGEKRPWTPHSSKSFKPQNDKGGTGNDLTYLKAIYVVVTNLVAATVLPVWLLTLPILPEKVRHIGTVKQQMPSLADELLQDQRRNLQDDSKNNLIKELVRALDETTPENKGKASLSKEEVHGNLFQFTVAGFDTTANTLAYSLGCLAMEPKWQSWVGEEINHICSSGDADKKGYFETYPTIVRIMAVMYETMRLYPPLMHTGRETHTEQRITIGSSSYCIPAKTIVMASLLSIHVDPKIWGSDAHEFRPSRWITTNVDGKEGLIAPAQNTFMPWSMGPRICPGMKMAQVEFAAVYFTLFRRARLEAVPVNGQSMADAQKDVFDIMQDSMPQVTLNMQRPGDLNLRWRSVNREDTEVA